MNTVRKSEKAAVKRTQARHESTQSISSLSHHPVSSFCPLSFASPAQAVI